MKSETKIRQYINITNHCNANCEFCCMWSSSEKKTFMNFEIFKSIIDSKNNFFELQIEGGEPLLHRDIYQFMEYAVNTKKCLKIIILTNGFLLDKHLNKLIQFEKDYKIPITVKISINYWLYNLDNNIIKKCKEIYETTKDHINFNVILNVRLRHGDEWLENMIGEANLKEISNIFYLQSYGKYENQIGYSKPVIVQNIDDWLIYSCDGKCFGKDLIARSNHEKEVK